MVISPARFSNTWRMMLLTNIPDFLPQTDIDKMRFHIPDYYDYKKAAFPYYFDDETGIIMDSQERYALLTLDMLDSRDWAFV